MGLAGIFCPGSFAILRSSRKIGGEFLKVGRADLLSLVTNKKGPEKLGTFCCCLLAEEEGLRSVIVLAQTRRLARPCHQQKTTSGKLKH